MPGRAKFYLSRAKYVTLEPLQRIHVLAKYAGPILLATVFLHPD
jgi:hypothetical protein